MDIGPLAENVNPPIRGCATFVSSPLRGVTRRDPYAPPARKRSAVDRHLPVNRLRGVEERPSTIIDCEITRGAMGFHGPACQGDGSSGSPRSAGTQGSAARARGGRRRLRPRRPSPAPAPWPLPNFLSPLPAAHRSAVGCNLSFDLLDILLHRLHRALGFIIHHLLPRANIEPSPPRGGHVARGYRRLMPLTSPDKYVTLRPRNGERVATNPCSIHYLQTRLTPLRRRRLMGATVVFLPAPCRPAPRARFRH